jgi:hypothetical protein
VTGERRGESIAEQLAALRAELEDIANAPLEEWYWKTRVSTVDRIQEGPRTRSVKRHAFERAYRQRRDAAIDEFMRDLLAKRYKTEDIVRRAEHHCAKLSGDEAFNPQAIRLGLKQSTLRQRLQKVRRNVPK